MVLLSPATDSSSGDDCLRSNDESNLSRLASFEPCMTEVNTRRMGMVLLSPATDSSSGDDCLRSHDESNLSRLASFEPCMTEGTINYGPYSSSLVDRKIYDRVAATPDAVPKHATSPYMMHRLWYYSPPSCSSPEMSCASDGTRNTKTANIASLQRNATRTVAHRDSTPPNSRLSSARTSARGEGETSHTDLTSDTVYGMQPQPLSALYTLSDRCRLIVNADGYYEHIPDLGSNSPEVAVGLQTGSNIEHPSMCSLQRSTSPASSSSTTSSSYNFTRLKGSVSLQKERTRACGSDWGGRIGSRERCSHTSSLKIGVYEHEAVRDGVMVPQRRDSGVGSSLSRSPSGPTTQRQVWSFLVRPAVNNSKTRCEATAASSDLLSGERADLDGTFIDDADLSHCIDALSVTEILRLRKLAFLRLSVLLERYGGSGMRVDTVTANTNNSNLRNWTVQKLLKRMRASDVKSTNGESSVFGMPLSVVHSRSGLSLPRGILEVMHFLSTHVADTVGIFRKNGVRSRIAELRTKCDVHPDQEVFPHSKGLDPLQVHDMADMLKQYFRELPDPLMTAKYSQLFANIFLYLPNDLRLNALQYAILLLPDENREALQTLLFFLRNIAVRSATNNMTAQNLAVCLAPSLFHLSTSRLNRVSPARRHKTIGTSGMPTEREMKESRAAQECLAHMIHYCLKLFVRPLGHDFEVPSSGGFNEPEMPFLTDLGISDGGNYKTCLLQKAKELIKEHNDRWKGWIVEGVVDGVEISSKKPLDGHPLRYFRAWADVEAPPKQLLMRLIRQRNIWDPYTINWRNVASLNDEDCDVFQYVLNDTPAHPTRDVLVVRLWRTNVKELRGGCVLVERSVRSSETQLLGGVPAVVLASRFLIEPCSGRSRVTYISRIDLRGRSNVWYGKVYGGMIARQISLLRDSFRRVDHKNDGPESNV
ncbi:unnamed protein product [Toxocara canis]|uniref:Rho-GAP domain-containing protein n=1 Tax=Toxocara canis TaxID=6265 RepID=A0A183URE9_TOXCA|nr:unnamed protein product [Toxocara canis]